MSVTLVGTQELVDITIIIHLYCSKGNQKCKMLRTKPGTWGACMVQWLERLPSTQVMIPGSWILHLLSLSLSQINKILLKSLVPNSHLINVVTPCSAPLTSV